MELLAGVVQSLTDAVLNGVIEEIQHVRSFKSAFETMQKKLELTKSLLADKQNLINKNEHLRVPLNQLREVICEADDVLIDCQMRGEHSSNNGSFCGCSWLRYNPFFLNQTSKRLKQINDKLEDQLTILRSNELQPNTIIADEEPHASESMSQDFNPPVVVGLEKTLNYLKGVILKKNHNRIAVVGIGGLGKTTIAQKIYHDSEVLKFFDKLVWITVSQTFNKERILRGLLNKLEESDTSDDRSSKGLMERLQEALEGKSCLIVMDDVWKINNVEWMSDLFGSIVTHTTGSCVIVTTRNREIAEEMGVLESDIYVPKALDKADGWSLLSKYAFFSSNERSLDPRFKKVGEEIVEKCKGLPLAIKVVGSLLRSKARDPSTWDDVLTTFRKSTDNEVMASLRLSYNDLPVRLKQLLVCFSIYPEDFEIRAQQLIHLWFVEGMISRTEIKLGYKYLSELVNRSLVEVDERRFHDGRVESCKVHDLVRDLIMNMAKEEGLCNLEENGKSYWAGLTDETEKEFLSKNLKLRVLLVLRPRCPVDFDRNSVPLLSLRILDFSYVGESMNTRIPELLGWIGSLKRLACLNLSDVKGLEEVPSSIYKLRNLQFFILRECTNLKRIHPSIKYLKNLIVLNMTSCPIENFPPGLSSLSNLQELYGFRVLIGPTTNTGIGLVELRNLTQLRVLSIVVSTNVNDQDAKISKQESNILAALKKLEVLIIDANKCDKKQVLEVVEHSLVPPPTLHELILKRYWFEKMPCWFVPAKLTKLQYLCIENSNIHRLMNPRVDTTTTTDEPEWSSIKGLRLYSLHNLDEDWIKFDDKFMRVNSLEISQCKQTTLKNFPCSVEHNSRWTRS